MPLLNYTTTIQAAKTVNEITEILRKHHASAIIQNYNNDSIESLSFEVQTQHGAAHILLPVNGFALQVPLAPKVRQLPQKSIKKEATK